MKKKPYYKFKCAKDCDDTFDVVRVETNQAGIESEVYLKSFDEKRSAELVVSELNTINW